MAAARRIRGPVKEKDKTSGVIKLGRFGQSKDTGRKINYVTGSWRSRSLGESQGGRSPSRQGIYGFRKKEAEEEKKNFFSRFISERNIIYEILFFDAIKNT